MGLLSGGGFQYYAGPDGLSSGVNSFADNFMKQLNSGREMKMKQSELDIMNQVRVQQLAQLKAEQERELGFQKALKIGIIPPQSENEAIFNAQTQNPDIVGYKTMPSGKQAAVLTDEGNQQIQGLMSGGFDSSKAMAAAMPYTKAEQFPQMLSAMKSIEMMPIEQRLKVLEIGKTNSEIDKNKSIADKNRREEDAKSHTVEQLTRVALFDPDPTKKAQAQAILDSIQERELNKRRAGATVVNIDNKVGAKGFMELSGEMGKDLVKQRTDVEGAVKALENLSEAQKLINSGIITGTGAEYLVNFGNFAQSRLGIDTGKGAVANTQAFASTMGTQVGQIIKQFGSGTGLSDADREYAEKIVGGKITLTEAAIKKLIGINKKAFENVITNYNKKADQVMGRPEAKGLPYDLRVDYNKQPSVMQELPPASSAKGRIVKRSDGIRLQSDGNKWNLVR
jgi:hypothetical protein